MSFGQVSGAGAGAGAGIFGGTGAGLHVPQAPENVEEWRRTEKMRRAAESLLEEAIAESEVGY